MTPINFNDNRPSIIIHSANPEDDKKKMILALVASVRWYSAYLFRGHSDISDNNDLFNIARLLEYVCNTVIPNGYKQNKQLIIYMNEVSEDEERDNLMAGLIGATRWYANSGDDNKYNEDEVDAQNLNMLVKLQQGLLKHFTL